MSNIKPNITISVIIPAYNIEKYIARALRSVLGQTRPADEIIVVDDGSTDGTAEEIKKFGDKVRYLYQANSGPSTARNTGIRAATCKWIAFLDGDDEWLPEYLQRQCKIITQNPELKWLGGNYIRCLCDENLKREVVSAEKMTKRLGNKNYFDDYLIAHLQGPHWCTDTMMVQQWVFDDIGFFPEGITKAEDLDMWLRIAFRYPQFGYSPEPGAIYHLIRPNNLSGSAAPADLYIDFFDRLTRQAEKAGRSEAFEPLATKLLRGWIRSMLFAARGQDIRKMIYNCQNLLSWPYRISIITLTFTPNLTAHCCRLLGKTVRLIGERQQLTRKPSIKKISGKLI